MRPESEILGRVRFLLAQELDQRVTLAIQRLPGHCTHNYRHPLDVRKKVDGEPNEMYNRISVKLPVSQTIGLCTLGKEDPEEWNGTICEDPVDAQRCPYFTSMVTKDQLWSEFDQQLKDIRWVETNLPEVYGLLWVLNKSEMRLHWWKRLWFWFLRFQTVSLPKSPVERLLPGRPE